jgi:hypothetical protein
MVRVSAGRQARAARETTGRAWSYAGGPISTPSSLSRRREFERSRSHASEFGLRDDLLEVRELGADIALLPLHRAGILAVWAVRKPSLWWLTLKCGVTAVTCVLGVIAAASTGGIGIAAAVAGCGAGLDCAEQIKKYIDPLASASARVLENLP